uniref:Protein aurora borealis n=1 Tax=Panagrellus redivivus TaxID=6233 RepID=A0A7E4VP62_PANRE
MFPYHWFEPTPTPDDLEDGNVVPSPSIDQDLKFSNKVSLLTKVWNKVLRRSSLPRGPPPNLDEEIETPPFQKCNLFLQISPSTPPVTLGVDAIYSASDSEVEGAVAGSETPPEARPTNTQPREIVIKSRHLQSLKPEDAKRIFHFDFDISELPTMKPAPPCQKPYEQNALHFQFRFSESTVSTTEETTPSFTSAIHEETMSTSADSTSMNTVSNMSPQRDHSILHPCKLSAISEEEDRLASVSNCRDVV